MIETIKEVAKEIRHKVFRSAFNSNLGEERIIQKLMGSLNKKGFCVDIAASDGTTQSNTLFLYQHGWKGIAVECDERKFAILASHYREFPTVSLLRTKVTPKNVISLLETGEAPKQFDFLNLDIDSYDYYVLEQILGAYRPKLICTEINEKIPPPIEFTVKYSPDHFWRGDHFYGQSLSQLDKLCQRFNYKLVAVHYNNAFIMPQEAKFRGLNPVIAYAKGYSGKADHLKKFPWNREYEVLQTLSRRKAVEFLNQKFSKYKGLYSLR